MQDVDGQGTNVPDTVRLSFLIGIAALASLAVADYGRAQDRPVAQVELVAQTPGKIATAQLVLQPPTIDGDVLGDPVWAGVEPTKGFLQSAPDEGQPASEETEVRIVFTEDTVYFGVVCYDRDPSSSVTAVATRP